MTTGHELENIGGIDSEPIDSHVDFAKTVDISELGPDDRNTLLHDGVIPQCLMGRLALFTSRLIETPPPGLHLAS